MRIIYLNKELNEAMRSWERSNWQSALSLYALVAAAILLLAKYWGVI